MPMPPLPGLNHECRRINDIISLAGERWTFVVITALDEGPHRFNELRRVIGGISQQMLTRTLRSLERDGMISRTVYPSVPPQVEYALTPLGASLAETVERLGRWAAENLSEIERNREAFDGRVEIRPGVRNAA